MSSPDNAGLFEFGKVKRTEMVGKDKGLVAVVGDVPDPIAQDKGPADPNVTETSPTEQWQQYGFISRPPKGAERLTVRYGSTAATIASRSVESAKVYGELAEGDVALFTTAGNVLKLGADGSFALLVPTDSGKQIVIYISPKDGGSFKLVIPSGQTLEISAKNGIALNAGLKNLTLASAGKIQTIGAQFVNACGVFMTSIAAKLPLVGVSALTPGAPNVFI